MVLLILLFCLGEGRFIHANLWLVNTSFAPKKKSLTEKTSVKDEFAFAVPP